MDEYGEFGTEGRMEDGKGDRARVPEGGKLGWHRNELRDDGSKIELVFSMEEY